VCLDNRTPQEPLRQEPFRYSRHQAAALLDAFLGQSTSTSARAFALEHQVPESTLRHWRKRHEALQADPFVRAFFESPKGLAVLQAISLSVSLNFQLPGLAGLRVLQSFYQDAGLAPFVACSFGSLRRRSRLLEDLVLRYAKEQRQDLGPSMPKREITLANDETFHTDNVCLVAADPVSGFLVVESYHPDRTAKSWKAAVEKGLEGLPVKVVQVTADEAKAIRCHAESSLGAHYSPDLMHLQQSLHQATGLALRSQVTAAKDLVQEREADYQAAALDAEASRPGLEGKAAQAALARAAASRSQAQARLARCEQNVARVKAAVRGVGDDYHPFDLEGRQVKAEELPGKLEKRLKEIEAVAFDAGLGEAAKKKVKRVQKMIGALQATLCWFWLAVTKVEAAQGWDAGLRELYREKALAWAYWEVNSGKGRNAKERKQRRELAQRLRQALEQDERWRALSGEEKERMLLVAKEAACRWQRSSSCVEGRNGRLRLKHHTKQGLTDRALAVQTALHNFRLKRQDGSTAAERFFGRKPQDLFSWLLERLPSLPRPAKPRKKAA